jgi:hypothetical protein
MTQEESALLIHRPRVDNSLLSTSISAVVVLDVVPVPADQQRFDPNVEEQLTELGAHFSETRWSRGSNRIVFDGLLYSPDRGAEIWIQRSGALLAMWHLLPEGQNKTFPAVAFCNQLIGTIVNALGALRLMDAVCPAHLCLSLARSDGWSLRVPERWTMTEPKPILGERLEFPVLYWDGADPGSESVMRLIRDWLDRLWNASGFRSCNLYDVNTGVPDWKSFAQWGDGS